MFKKSGSAQGRAGIQADDKRMKTKILPIGILTNRRRYFFMKNVLYYGFIENP